MPSTTNANMGLDTPPPIPTKSARRGNSKITMCDMLFNTDKVAEQIFLRLPMRDILVNVQRVSKRWNAIVKNSDSLQEALFFKPISRPIKFVKPHKDVYAENAVKAAEETPKTPVGSSPGLDRLMGEWPFASPCPATTATQHARNPSEASSSTTSPNTSFEMPSTTRTPTPITDPTSPTNSSQKKTKLRHKPSRLFKIGRHRAVTSSEDLTDVSSSPVTSPTTPVPRSRPPSDKWVRRSYAREDASDRRQRIYEHPLVSRNDAPFQKYSLHTVGGRPGASWRKQLVIQPPTKSVRVIRDNCGNKLDCVVHARDGVGVKLGEVADALSLKTMIFLTFEGRAWWRRYKWTEEESGRLLDNVKPGIGHGAWFEIQEDDLTEEDLPSMKDSERSAIGLGVTYE